MPFTPSHAVLALPFIRTPLIPSAIAIGAMTPDLPLFLRGFGVTYAFTHTYANVLWTTVLALGLFLIWRVVLRPAASELSPSWLARRLPRSWDEPAADAVKQAIGVGQRRSYVPLLVLSLLLGVVSHILWDAFTHAGRIGSQLFPALAEQWGPLQGFKWLQHGSSVVGLAIIGVWALLWLRRSEPQDVRGRTLPPWARVSWWFSLPVILIAAWVIGYLAYGPFTAGFTIQHLAYRVLPPACGIWAMLTLVLCVVIAIVGGRRPTGAVRRS
ncbi:DUF4184 family protein [Microbacterium murale]|uniref:Membrane-bound metal-dependent hydrolase YbcI (DUF457 family) n=1 Tax=Microbacterium murale TaxID=1081040 RepID=A0ABU0P424_9MICO|nr:DUF4184 family protein [Microbacterium murale]MDQ0642078.1 membrane-bound metal-dependent hydrolase YbcI (DUF457 family) [Microbacterium murale]